MKRVSPSPKRAATSKKSPIDTALWRAYRAHAWSPLTRAALRLVRCEPFANLAQAAQQ